MRSHSSGLSFIISRRWNSLNAAGVSSMPKFLQQVVHAELALPSVQVLGVVGVHGHGTTNDIYRQGRQRHATADERRFTPMTTNGTSRRTTQQGVVPCRIGVHLRPSAVPLVVLGALGVLAVNVAVGRERLLGIIDVDSTRRHYKLRSTFGTSRSLASISKNNSAVKPPIPATMFFGIWRMAVL